MMYSVRSNSGIGAYDCASPLLWYLSSSCWSQPAAAWAGQMPTAVAPPRAPTGPVLTIPPASGADAQQTVDDLLNQQMIDQQAKDAAGVTSSWWDKVVGSPAAAVDAAGNLIPSSVPWGWIAAGFGVLALGVVAVGGGSPRRYGG